jgi:hypothetical protein
VIAVAGVSTFLLLCLLLYYLFSHVYRKDDDMKKLNGPQSILPNTSAFQALGNTQRAPQTHTATNILPTMLPPQQLQSSKKQQSKTTTILPDTQLQGLFTKSIQKQQSHKDRAQTQTNTQQKTQTNTQQKTQSSKTQTNTQQQKSKTRSSQQQHSKTQKIVNTAQKQTKPTDIIIQQKYSSYIQPRQQQQSDKRFWPTLGQYNDQSSTHRFISKVLPVRAQPLIHGGFST